MRRRPIFYAYLASALLIGLPLWGASAQTGSGSTSGSGGTQGGTGTTGTRQNGTTGTSGTRSGTTGTRSSGSGYMNGNGTGTGTDMNGSYGQPGVTGNGVTGTGTGRMRVGDPYNGPAVNFSTTPDIAVIPGTQISYIRNGDYDMYRSGTDWYYRYDGKWYRGTSYSGPFTYVTTTSVPRGIRTVPAKYRHHWTSASSTSSGTSVSGTRSRNASASKARVKSRHKTRTTSYSKTRHTRATRSHSTSSMGTGTGSSYDDSHASGMDNSSSSAGSSMGGNSMNDNGTSMGTTSGSTSTGMGSSGSMGSMAGTAGQPYSGPAITFQSPPTVAIIPGTQVSYLRNSDYDMYRYGSDWYMNYNGTWYRGSAYSGPYVSVEASTVPQPITTVPSQYRRHWGR